MAKISVLIPAYNAEKYIEKCIQSVRNQTLFDIEIIVIDDGSTDGTLKKLKYFASIDSRIHVYTQENQGLYKTRRKLLSLATGDYVGWVDADDFIAPTMYETLYTTATKNNSDLTYCNYSFYPEKITTKEKWFRIYKGIVDVNFIERNSQVCNKIVRRDLLNNLGVGEMFEHCFDESYIKVLLEAHNPISINEELYFYRMGQSMSMSSSYKNVEHYIQFIEAAKCLKNEMKYFWSGNSYWKEYFEYRIIYYTIISMLVAANANEKNIYINLKQALQKSYPHYHHNRHIYSIAKENFGWIKGIGIEYGVTLNYYFAHILASISLK